MTVMPAASFLKDFSDCLPEAVSLSPEMEAALHADALEAARAEGYQQGREEAAAEAAARAEQREAEFNAELAARLDAERAAWVSDHAQALADALARGLQGLRDDMLSVTAEVLKPFLCESVRQKAIAELSETVAELLQRQPETTLAISGPPDLLKSMELHLSDHAGAVTFTPNQSVEVEVKAGHALLSTRIAAWVDKINEATS